MYKNIIKRANPETGTSQGRKQTVVTLITAVFVDKNTHYRFTYLEIHDIN